MFSLRPPKCRICFSSWKPRKLKKWGGYYDQCPRCALQEAEEEDEIWWKTSEAREHWNATLRPEEVETELFSEGSPYLRRNPIYYGSAGAGMLFKCGNQILLLKRSRLVREPGTWGIPGGALTEEFIDSDAQTGAAEQPRGLFQTAIKETQEELGGIPPFKPLRKIVYRDGSFIYVTYLVEITQESKMGWKFLLNWENTDARWFTITALPSNLHFGVKYALSHIGI